jgi:hypothetical protein
MWARSGRTPSRSGAARVRRVPPDVEALEQPRDVEEAADADHDVDDVGERAAPNTSEITFVSNSPTIPQLRAPRTMTRRATGSNRLIVSIFSS